jgi:hypothetical protein
MSGKILPFQQLSTRKRKDVNEGTVTVQVCVFAFDILFLNGESLLKVPCVCVCVCVCARALLVSLSRSLERAHYPLSIYVSLSCPPAPSSPALLRSLYTPSHFSGQNIWLSRLV